MPSLLSAGFDHFWRETAAKTASASPEGATLDSASALFRQPEGAWQRPANRLTCEPNELHLWRHDLRRYDATVDESEPGALWLSLSGDERARAARFHFARDRNSYVAARGGLRRVLSRYTEIPPADLAFSYGARGKPALVYSGIAPKLAFNVAHSGAYAVYAVGCRRQVGIDVERIRPEVAIEDLAAANFSPKERRALLALSRDERLRRFFALWTCKEAYVKARGEGLFIPLDSFHVVFGRDGSVRLEAEDGPWYLQVFPAAEGYPAAVVTDGSVLSCRFYEL
jgi:4'-phosphopantetheinyl transferase